MLRVKTIVIIVCILLRDSLKLVAWSHVGGTLYVSMKLSAIF